LKKSLYIAAVVAALLLGIASGSYLTTHYCFKPKVNARGIAPLDFYSQAFYENEFVGKSRRDLIQIFGRPAYVYTCNIKQMNLVGCSQVLIPKEQEISSHGGDLIQVAFEYGPWITYIWEMKDGRIVASVRYDRSRINW
jgi:hypothetical protein